MATLPQSTDYTDKDYEAIRLRSFNLIRSVFPSWTDTAVSNFGNLLVESFSWILDVLTFYQDQQAREGRFGTAVLRKSMIALCKLIGYELSGAIAATTDVLVTCTNASALTGTIRPANPTDPVVVKTNEITDPIRGELISPSPFTINAATGYGTFTWEHSLTQPRYIVASTNRADQTIMLPFAPFLEDSEVVQTLSQGTFTKVDSFYNSAQTDTHYRVQVDHNDKAEIIFGDNVNGVIPSGDILIDYKTGGGIYGNVEAGSLIVVEGSFVDSTGRTAYLTATNAAAAEGGTPREEVEGARINAPASLRVLNRTVCREDYEINSLLVDGVGRALMLTSNEDVAISENRGKLYIIPTTGGTPSQILLDQVKGVFGINGYSSPLEGGTTYNKTITFQLEVLPASYMTIDIIATVWIQNNYAPSTVKASIEQALEDYFEPMLASGAPNPNVDFGYNYKDADGEPAGEIAWSDIFNIVRDVGGVRKVGAGTTDFTLNGLHDDVSIPNWQFPQLGTVTLINGDTGDEI